VVATTEKCPWCGSTITHAKFLQIQAAIREDEKKKLADAEKTLRAQLEKEVAVHAQKLMKERQALDADRAKMAKQFDLSLKKEVANVREILQKDREAALLRKDAEFAREREALQKKISDMSRRVKKGLDVGEGGELDLYDELREAFPEDQITRVKGKGSAAPGSRRSSRSCARTRAIPVRIRPCLRPRSSPPASASCSSTRA
jgi:DNA repair exonuclease SbcCD ATPase subunit